MSDVIENQDPELPDEKSLLMQRARLMGLNVSNNIGLETLKKKIQSAMEGESKESETSSQEKEGNVTPEPKLTPQQFRRKLSQEALKLVRLRITNLDPKKKNVPGEIITVANRYIGTVRKFIPFGAHTDNGYHVPHCIYEFLRDRRFNHVQVTEKNGKKFVRTSEEREFSLEVLPPLTQEELRRLALSQAAAAGSLDD